MKSENHKETLTGFLQQKAFKTERKIIELNNRYKNEMMELITEYNATKCELNHYELPCALTTTAEKITDEFFNMNW